MCRQAAAKTADPSGPAVLVCYQAKTALLSDNRTGGASALASAAVDASASVDDSHAVLNLHSANRASALAGAAADTCVTNLMCHNRTLLSTRASRTYVAGNHPPEVCSCTAAASLSQETPSKQASVPVPIVAKTNRKGKTNCTPAKHKPAFLAECTKPSAHFRGVSIVLFVQDYNCWDCCKELPLQGDYPS